MYILLVGFLVIITGIAIHFQYKFSILGHSRKAFFIALIYTNFSFLFYEDFKTTFVVMFFIISSSFWCMFVGSLPVNKTWAVDPYKEHLYATDKYDYS